MNLSPTTRHYLISFAAGLLITIVGIAAEQLSGPEAQFHWTPFLWSLAGGAVMFARDWLRNNSGAFLENTPPGQAAQALPVIMNAVPLPAAKPLDTIEPPAS